MTKTRLQKKFELPDGCDCTSLVVREVTNRDRMDSVAWAQESAPAPLQANPFAMIGVEQNELIRISVVSVDGVAVEQPYRDIDGWSVRTWKFLEAAYAEVNGPDLDELKNFRGAIHRPTETGSVQALEAS